MKKILAGTALALGVLGHAAGAHAIPSLQLDILGGWYNADTVDGLHSAETIVAPVAAPGEPSSLYAYLIPDDQGASLGSTYIISAAVYPAEGLTPDADMDLGSITINGVTFQVTHDMVFGNPPIETFVTQSHDPGDLASHGIYDTYYLQLAFTFDPDDRALAYNVQDEAGSGPTPDPAGTMYYRMFQVDTTGLDEGYFLHFDLYNVAQIPVVERVRQVVLDCNSQGNCREREVWVDTVVGDDYDIVAFAPFSHDAESDGRRRVPEPATALLLGAGMLGLAVLRRKAVHR